ncbi:hypothetical protein HMI54_011459 [Coelomomyces lativittatus]|nr:hypothetical protein HMI54_011459 [Coelomomyces lativittatus]
MKSTYDKEQVWVSDDDKDIEIRSYNGYELANQEKFEVMNVQIKSGKKMDTVLQDQIDTEGYVIHIDNKETLVRDAKCINMV